MSVTRLLVLGAVRIFQPAHGYLVMRELTSWQVDSWAHVKPGSIYNALKTLAKQRLLEEETGADGKVVYRLSADGESEFQRLLREAAWKVHAHDPAWLYAAMSLWWALPRAEVLDALDARTAQLEAEARAGEHAETAFVLSRVKPDFVVEFWRLRGSEIRGELEWVRAVAARIKDGAYAFADDPAEKFDVPGGPLNWPANPGH